MSPSRIRNPSKTLSFSRIRAASAGRGAPETSVESLPPSLEASIDTLLNRRASGLLIEIARRALATGDCAPVREAVAASYGTLTGPAVEWFLRQAGFRISAGEIGFVDPPEGRQARIDALNSGRIQYEGCDADYLVDLRAHFHDRKVCGLDEREVLVDDWCTFSLLEALFRCRRGRNTLSIDFNLDKAYTVKSFNDAGIEADALERIFSPGRRGSYYFHQGFGIMLPTDTTPDDVDLENCITFSRPGVRSTLLFDRLDLGFALMDLFPGVPSQCEDGFLLAVGLGCFTSSFEKASSESRFHAFEGRIRLERKERGVLIRFPERLRFAGGAFLRTCCDVDCPEIEDAALPNALKVWEAGDEAIEEAVSKALAPLRRRLEDHGVPCVIKPRIRIVRGRPAFEPDAQDLKSRRPRSDEEARTVMAELFDGGEDRIDLSGGRVRNNGADKPRRGR